ncbi:hypothetical protein [Marinobacterium rhizophilum]|uniref:Outer membrane lipoprotein n=1 Tax=Marinobacterium rhizophilum TaxID=420402 RepID=A0ABY5HF54_9GAMM|nr:hypothetical protein [Marinobacterium rhizophilum]UTW10868.1 hypothetical protein KDW95_16495 [Marinobacterium rhizophilum]
MKPLHRAPLILTAAVLASCASPSYWYEPPTPDSLNPLTLNGNWQGLARHAYSHKVAYGALAGAVEIDCARYQDLISLSVQDGKVEGTLGRAPSFNFSTTINASGEFRHQMPVRGDTWIYGGVGIFNNEPQLKIWGKLDSASGIGTGQIAVTPKDETLGCGGRFQLSHNSAAPPQAQLGTPFKVQYWINRAEGSNRSHRSWPSR